MPTHLMDHPMVKKDHSWSNFTHENHVTWKKLFKRQTSLLKDRASQKILDGMHSLEICGDQIPTFEDLNSVLQEKTGFSIVPVKGFIPEDLFFGFLSQRKFPSTCFIREAHQMDYLEEPDIFHDVFGHIPLLVHPVFADFMELFGRKGLESIEKGFLKLAAALYWFTVEFGLVQEQGHIKIYGAGILSSQGESVYALDDPTPQRLRFHMIRAMKTLYRIDAFQTTYFVIESFEQLFRALLALNWDDLKEWCVTFPSINSGICLSQQENIIGELK